jgi:hypothetical protein
MPSTPASASRAPAASSAWGASPGGGFVDKARRDGAYFALAGAEVAELADAHV